MGKTTYHAADEIKRDRLTVCEDLLETCWNGWCATLHLTTTSTHADCPNVALAMKRGESCTQLLLPPEATEICLNEARDPQREHRYPSLLVAQLATDGRTSIRSQVSQTHSERPASIARPSIHLTRKGSKP